MSRTSPWNCLSVPLGMLLIVVFASVPVIAADYNSASEKLLRSLHHQLLWVAIPLAILVEGVLFYAMIKFHNNDNPKPTKENRRLEITWTIAVAIILLFVGASSYVVLTSPMVSTYPSDTHAENGTVEVDVIGQNWFWTFKYPDGNVTTTNTMVLPANRTIVFNISSRDLVHSVHIPALGVKEDAFPGRTNTFKTRLTETGTYRLYCAEFCGTGHSKMLATVKVVPPKQYHRWLRQQKRSPTNDTENTST